MSGHLEGDPPKDPATAETSEPRPSPLKKQKRDGAPGLSGSSRDHASAGGDSNSGSANNVGINLGNFGNLDFQKYKELFRQAFADKPKKPDAKAKVVSKDTSIIVTPGCQLVQKMSHMEEILSHACELIVRFKNNPRMHPCFPM